MNGKSICILCISILQSGVLESVYKPHDMECDYLSHCRIKLYKL
jgi:hypothetical protein